MSTFEKWFLAQHGPRMTDNKITDSDLAEMIEEGARAEGERHRRQLWDAQFQSALYAWQASSDQTRTEHE